MKTKSKLSQGTLGHIFESMEKLGNAICLENGLYQQTELGDKDASDKSRQARKTLRLSHLARKKNGKFYKSNSNQSRRKGFII